MNLTEFYKFKSICGSGSGGSDSGDSTVVIYDGDVTLEYGGENYNGGFTPSNEPQSGENINVSINSQAYTLNSVETSIWQDGTTPENSHIAIVKMPDGYSLIVIDSSILPSQDSPQTVSVKITQVQSGSEEKTK